MVTVVTVNNAKEIREVLTILLFIYYSCNVANGIQCREGPAVTYKVPVNYTVSRQSISQFGCLEGFRSEESTKWPGAPADLDRNISTADSSFQLSWKPPGDASAADVIGFLLEMYVEEIGDTSSSFPSMCYMVGSKLASEHHSTVKLPEVLDAVFHLECKMQQSLNVRVKVITLPVPQGGEYKKAVVHVVFKGTTPRPSTILPNPVTKLLKGTPEEDFKSASMVAISLGVVFVSVFVTTVVVFMVCRNRRHSYSISRSHIDTSEENEANDVLSTNNTNLQTVDFNGSHPSEIQTVDHNRTHVSEMKGEDVSIPKKYQLQLQRINLDT